MIKKLLICAILIIALVVPALAQTVTYSAGSTKAIQYVDIISNPGTSGTITFYFSNGSTMQGTWAYLPVLSIGDYNLVYQGIIGLDSQQADKDYVTQGTLFVEFNEVGQVTNTSNKMKAGMGQITGIMDTYITASAPQDVIIKFSFTSDNDVTYYYGEVDRATLTKNLGLTNDGNWLTSAMVLAYDSFWIAYDFVGDLVYWLKFFFIDNLAMIVALFLAVPMAFAAKNSRGNPEKFLRQYFKTLKGFFEFVLSTWRMLTETIGTIIGWFKGWI